MHGATLKIFVIKIKRKKERKKRRKKRAIVRRSTSDSFTSNYTKIPSSSVLKY